MSEPRPTGASARETAIKAVVAAVPLVGGPLSVVLGDELERRRERAGHFAAEVAGQCEIGALPGRLRDDEDFARLFMDALDAAVRTTLERKRRALARVIALAMADQAVTDEIELMLLALKDLEGPHIRALARLHEVQAEAGVGAAIFETEIAAEVPTPVAATLQRHGAVTVGEGGDGLVVRRVTGFGARLLQYLGEGDPEGVADEA